MAGRFADLKIGSAELEHGTVTGGDINRGALRRVHIKPRCFARRACQAAWCRVRSYKRVLRFRPSVWRPGDVVDMGVGYDNRFYFQIVFVEDVMNGFQFVTRIDNDGFAGLFVAEYGAVQASIPTGRISWIIFLVGFAAGFAGNKRASGRFELPVYHICFVPPRARGWFVSALRML